VVDLHAITVWQDPEKLRANTREVTAALLASGIDPSQNIIFNQSQVPGHAELAWIFNCVSRMGWLNRMTQFKEKAGKQKENASIGLFAYPCLMAADILLYKATHVPVGEDQKQHLELTRDIAHKFNTDFKKQIFPIVEPLIFGAGTRVMSLRDGTKKMSKSDPSDLSRINMTDDANSIHKKIRKAKSDANILPNSQDGFKGRPEVTNLMNIFAALSDINVDEVCQRFGGEQFSTFKMELADLAVVKLASIQDEMRRLIVDTEYVDSVLLQGTERAQVMAEPVLDEVRETIGFLKSRA
jgi:tryptophanyl-tRNA synthetase